MTAAALPYWRLSGFYFFYFAVVGTMVPYWGLYLQSLDFSAADIGQIGAIMMLTRVVAPNIWSWLGDRCGRRLTLIRWGSLLACLCFLALFVVRDFWPVALAVAAYSFFWNAVLAQFEVVTLGYLGARAHHYSRIRVWGSVGFIVVVAGLGVAFDRLSIRWLPAFGLLFLTLVWLSNLTLHEPQSRLLRPARGDLWRALKRPEVLAFLVSSCLLQVSHGSYYTFYSLYLEQLGYGRGLIGLLWALGVVAEVIIFMLMPRLFAWRSERWLLLATLALTVLRWALIAVCADSLPLLLFAQLLHAFSFGTAHAIAIELIRKYFAGPVQGQGQALYSAFSFGLGGAIGAVGAGAVWGVSATLAFGLSAIAALLAYWLVWRYMPLVNSSDRASLTAINTQPE